MQHGASKESVQRQSSSDTKIKSIIDSTLFAFVVRVAFVVMLVVGSRMFLSFKLGARGRTDVLTSITMMLLLIFLIERFAPRILRGILLFFVGASLLFFHLLNGLYYRFFNCPVPFDIFRQWRDVFVVGGYGVGLMSIPELIAAVIVPLFLLLWILRKPSKGRPLILIVLLVIATVGWTHRLNRPIRRSVTTMAALPDYLHRLAYRRFKLGLKEGRYLSLIRDIETLIPRYLEGYRVVKDKGVTVEPIEPFQKNEPLQYNIILIIAESLRAYECGFLGAIPSYTPKLDELTKNARVYTTFYANGTQTVRAEIGLLCSIYPNPVGAPTYVVNPNLELVCLPQILSEVGYDTLWFSGYTADFHNKRVFLSKHGIKKIFDRDVLPSPKQPIIGWGMNDQEMFGYVWNILKDCDEPFFAQITTLSNHCGKSKYPTEADTPTIEASVAYRRYLEGTYYTDYAMSEFIEKVQSSELAKNTIIIVTGDHGLWMFPPSIADFMQKLEIYFRVPLCIWGPPDLIQPGRDNTLGSHVDLSPTLLDVLNIYHTNMFLGQSMWNSDIPREQRYVVTYLGSIPYIRVGDVFTLPADRIQEETTFIKYIETENMDFGTERHLDFATVEGDLLYGRYNIRPFEDKNKVKAFSKRLDDITFLTAYGIYFNAFKGIR